VTTGKAVLYQPRLKLLRQNERVASREPTRSHVIWSRPAVQDTGAGGRTRNPDATGPGPRPPPRLPSPRAPVLRGSHPQPPEAKAALRAAVLGRSRNADAARGHW
jgi:hypothetical protein